MPSLRQRPGCDQEVDLRGGDPTSSRCSTPRMLVCRSAAWLVRVLIRRARLRMACLVAVSSSRGPPAGGTRRIWRPGRRSTSWSRKSTGALMMRASSLIAAVRAVWAPRRVDSSARSASRRPRARGTARSGVREPPAPPGGRRASVLAPSLVAAVRGWLGHLLAGRAEVRADPDP